MAVTYLEFLEVANKKAWILDPVLELGGRGQGGWVTVHILLYCSDAGTFTTLHLSLWFLCLTSCSLNKGRGIAASPSFPMFDANDASHFCGLDVSQRVQKLREDMAENSTVWASQGQQRHWMIEMGPGRWVFFHWKQTFR